ncbi:MULTISPECIES: nucleoside-diphosphate sugar epimerase/dehydratase [unclassified Dehalobacter]|uniref:polysaccharide biosynthesis protein n=1 Tax=unclassified Dehalobacter TaxID=2635733 RepID=UPI000377E07A|nr:MULTISPECIES: nucleoside-diphosphate sugar epimerase/dehydratase [unclassified Dehalobacter]
MAHPKRTLFFMLTDAILINLALFLSFYLRLSEEADLQVEFVKYLGTYLNAAIVSTFVLIVVFHFFGLYKNIWRYASVRELLSIVYAVTVGAALTVMVVYFISPLRLPHSVSVYFWLMLIVLIGGLRFSQRMRQENAIFAVSNKSQRKVLIIGAGDAGVLALRELKKRDFQEGVPVGFIDDSKSKINLHVQGFPVLGSRDDIPRIAEDYAVDEIIIAIPSADGEAVREIVEICKETRAALKIMPGVYDILSGKITVSSLREVQVEDLLGREQVSVDLEEVAGYLKNQVVLVTGAGGSIGSELCRQIVKFFPSKLILAGHGENCIFDIEQELKNFPIVTEIFDIKDAGKVNLVFEKYKPSVVFHAAAHKHVPLMEVNPEEALKNNVMGTSNLAAAADKNGVRTFVLISTDKAVNPTSIMGASKRMAEMVIQDYDKRSETKFVAVRFGNVLGSRGSVIPTFKKQIMAGGPVTVTDPRMTRYFMTIPEASQLVIQAGAMASGGEIFILDMGKPVKIVDLAKDLIRLSGFEPGKDIQIEFTGVRPGEKLFEEILTSEEGTTATKHKRIFVARPNHIDHEAIEGLVQKIRERGSYMDREEINTSIRTLLPDFGRP